MDSFEIARLAGVSRKTVTRVLNNYEHVHPKTREKVWRVIRDNKYMPNASARQLSRKKSNTIGIIIIQEFREARIFTDDLYYGPVIGSIVDAASVRGYNVCVAMANVEDPENSLSLFREKRIDAGVLLGWNESEPLMEEIREGGYCFGAIVHCEAHGEGAAAAPILDDRMSAYQAAAYLLDLGHRDIGFIAGPASNHSSGERLEGFRQALAERGTSLAKNRIYCGNYSEQSGEGAAEEWLRQGTLPTAVFASNDWAAIGLMRRLQQLGIRIPEEVSVMGFDDIIISKYTSPRLTTMRVPTVEMGVHLTHCLLDSLEGKEPSDTMKRFTAQLTVRDSCRAL